ncbi:MAG: PorP/SprF family type IX secretion system membrane protein [Chitinophagales bacterium]
MKLRLYSVLVVILSVMAVNAQDIHFSQFYAAPLTLNPALTGNFNGFYRISGIYRNQYPGLTQSAPAFSTPSVSADLSLLRDKIKRGSLGVGLVFVNDQQNGKTFMFNHILASVAYNMAFDPKGRFQLGVGLQGGIMTTKIDDSKLKWAEGYNPDGTYNNSYSLEAINARPGIKGAFNAGIFLKSEFYTGMRVYAGYALNNITRFKENYVGTNGGYHHPFRHTVHGGFEFDVKDKAVIIPGVLYQNMASASEVNFGVTGGIHVVRDPAKRATLFLGLWNRLNTGNYTIIPKVGFAWKGFSAGFAYDAHLTQQRKDYKNIGGAFPQAFEITLSYVGNLFVPKEDSYLFNPRY